MGKNGVLILLIGGLFLVAVLAASGCTSSKDYNITVQNATYSGSFSEQEAIETTQPLSSDAGAYNITDYGTKTVNGIKLYYISYTDYTKTYSSKIISGGDVYFQKNNNWYYIHWNDKLGNPNKNSIDSEIANKIKNI